MKKALKIILGIVVILAGAVLGVGFGTDATFDQRHSIVIDAPLAKVSALLLDPARTKEWMPADMVGIESTEIVKTAALGKVAGALVDQALGGGSNAGKDLPTHIYHLKDGKTLEVQTVDHVPGKKVTERVVGGTSDIPTMFKRIAWGWEMEPADGGKTKLTMLSSGEANKPLPNFVNHVMAWMHMDDKNARKMALSIETAAKR